MTIVSKKDLLARRSQTKKYHDFDLPSGGTARMKIPGAKEYRDWRKYLRTSSGDAIPERLALSDELLIADLLVDESNTPMFTREEVMRGGMDDLLQVDLEKMKEEAYRLTGQFGDSKPIFDEDREKNSSTTAPSE